MIRRLPKRGFRRKAGLPTRAQVLNVEDLNRCTDGERVTAERLRQLGLIRNEHTPVKLLGDGSLAKRVTVIVHAASESAKAKVTQAGGSIELIRIAPKTA